MPNPRRASRVPALLLAVVAACVVALVATTLSTPSVAATRHARAGVTHSKAKPDAHWSRAVRAKHALARVKKTFAPETPANERPNATLVLRNLSMLRDALSPADQKVAAQFYKRPTYGQDKSGGCPPSRCSGVPATLGDDNLLMHYDPTELGYDPNVAFSQLQYVANTYAASGYRRPKPDKGKGGDSRTDIYIAQLQPGLYGYCTTDQRPRAPHFDVWAYCVLDADYAGFPRTPIENFEVTIAHEYYHATQFAYDIADDGWFMEATAAWVEDEMYTDINDDFQYLADSPITHPGKPIDKFGGVFHYGVWNFFRYLSEHYPTKTGALPTLMLKMWQYADSSKSPRKDLYSVEAIDKALRKAGHTSLAEQFANYSAATRDPAVTFSEGAALGYPQKPLGKSPVSLPAGKKKTFKAKLDHLSSSTFQFVPGGGTSKLKLTLRMAPKSHGSRAVAAIYGTGGTLTFVNIKVNRRGVGHKKVVFDGTVAAVEVTLVNASTRYINCFREKPVYSCSGTPVDDNERARVKGKAA